MQIKGAGNAAYPATSSTQKPGHLPADTHRHERSQRAQKPQLNNARNERQQAQVQTKRHAPADWQRVVLAVGSATQHSAQESTPMQGAGAQAQ